MSDVLPQGWTRATIGDVAAGMKNGLYKPASSYVDNGVACLRMYNIDAGKIVWKNIKRMKLTEQEVRDYQLLPGDLLVNRVNSRELVGKAAIVPRNAETCVFESKNIRLRLLRHLVCPELVNYKLLLSGSQHFLHNAQQVVGMASISQPQLAAFELPLPPLAEQRRIVAKLERLLAKVDNCQTRLARIPAVLKRFRQSVLAAACSGRLTADWREENPDTEPTDRLGDGEAPSDFDLPATWNWLRSSHAFGFVTSGSRGWAQYYSDDGALFLRVGNLNHDAINLDLRSIQRVFPPASAEGRRTKVLAGDILISITADVGMIALVEAGLEEAYINQHVALARPIGNMERKYLAYFLAAKNGGQEQFLNLQRGATKVGLGLDDIRNIWIARPPLPEQQEIVRRIEKLFGLADRLEGRFAEGRKRVDSITQAILAKAFRGELVPTEFELAKSELARRRRAASRPLNFKLCRNSSVT
jgi:type I restriction enzyme S subunit